MRIALHLEPVMAFSDLTQGKKTKEPDYSLLFQTIAEADLAGVDGLIFRLQDNQQAAKSAKVLSFIKSMTRCHFTVEIPNADKLLRVVMEIKPDQITITSDRVRPLSGIDVASDISEMKELVESIHSAGIEAGFLIDPDIPQVKAVRKTGADIVNLNSSTFSYSGNQDTILYYEELEKASLAASSLELRVLAQGGIDRASIANLAQVRSIEECVLGYRFLRRTFFTGLGDAVREIRNVILHNQAG